MSERFFDRYFVWWSSRESIEAGKISVLAVAEVILSVAAYWWAAWYFDTYAHLLVSLAMAPFVLLRSENSVALGLKLFGDFWRSDDQLARSRRTTAVDIIAIAFLSIPIGLVAPLVNKFEWSWGGLLVASAIIIYFSILTFAQVVSGTKGWTQVYLINELAKIVGVTGKFAKATATLTAPFFGLGAGLGILSQAFGARIYATLRYVHVGASAFPKNWRSNLFFTDICFPPELLPGIGTLFSELGVKNMLNIYLRNSHLSMKIIGVVFAFIFFTPSVTYRYSIKSTCWLYLPLIYLVHLPGRMRDGEGRLVWVRALPSKVLEWVRFGIAIVSLGAAALALVESGALATLLRASWAGETPVTVFSLLLVLDFGKLHPWQYPMLPSALLTVWLFFWLDSIRKDEAAGASVDAMGWKIRTAIVADRLRSLCVYLWLALALYYFVGYAHAQCRLPAGMSAWLEWQFGPACWGLPVRLPA